MDDDVPAAPGPEAGAGSVEGSVAPQTSASDERPYRRERRDLVVPTHPQHERTVTQVHVHPRARVATGDPVVDSTACRT